MKKQHKDNGNNMRPLSMDPMERAGQLRDAAEHEAYRRIVNGTAPASLLQYFMDKDPDRESYKTQKIAAESALASAKAASIEAAQQAAIDQAAVLEALKRYTGNFNRSESEAM